MNVCLVWDSDYPWDVRAEKMAQALTDAGHKVALVARNRRRSKTVERRNEATVHRLPEWPWMSSWLNNAASFPFFGNPIWGWHILETARRTGANVIICRDLPLALTCFWAARRLGIPCVLDMAENYPAMMQALWDSQVHRPHDWLVRNPRAVAAIERWVIRSYDHILVVVEESGQRLESLGVPASKITVVGNTPPRSRANQPASVAPTADDAVEIIYLGLLEAPRGIGQLLKAMKSAKDERLPVRLTLIGDGRERLTFEKEARSLAINDIVTFRGFVPNEQALRALHSTHVGVVPHLPNASWNSTIPNKLFDYMAAGLAVLSSDAIPAARVVREAKCGEVFVSSDPESLLASLRRLCDREYRLSCGRAGRESILSTHNWENDTSRLINTMAAVATAGTAK